MYLVPANYGQTSHTIETAETYIPADTPSAQRSQNWEILKRSLRIIGRSV